MDIRKHIQEEIAIYKDCLKEAMDSLKCGDVILYTGMLEALIHTLFIVDKLDNKNLIKHIESCHSAYLDRQESNPFKGVDSDSENLKNISALYMKNVGVTEGYRIIKGMLEVRGQGYEQKS